MLCQIYVFWDRDLKFWLQLCFCEPIKSRGQILPNCTFWMPNRLFQVKCRYHYSKIYVSWDKCMKFWHLDFNWDCTWNMPFWILNVQLGKIWPRRFNGLEKTKLEPKFEVSISKNIETGQQSSYQKIWKIALSGPKNSVPKNMGPKNFGP